MIAKTGLEVCPWGNRYPLASTASGVLARGRIGLQERKLREVLLLMERLLGDSGGKEVMFLREKKNDLPVRVIPPSLRLGWSTQGAARLPLRNLRGEVPQG